MLKTTFRPLACAAVLALATQVALASPVQGDDFDQSGIDVPRVVLEARGKAAESGSSAAPEGKHVPGKQAAAADQVARRIVVFKRGIAPTRMAQLISASGGTVTKTLRIINAVAVAAPQAKLQSFQNSLISLPEVERVEEDYYQNWLVGAGAPASGVLPRPPHATRPPLKEDAPPEQNTPWGIDRVGAPGAWGVTRGQGVKVAVVDTGVDTSHPDLKVVGGHNAVEAGQPYNDDNGHGTHVAGTIAALDNSEGVVGVAPNASLYAVKVLASDGSGTFAGVIEGIQWCAENGIKIANFSLGASRGTQALQEAVAAAVAAGVAIIAAAGNSGGSVSFPGAYPEAIAVAASDKESKVASFSSRGPEVDLIAPGVDISSTYMGGGYDELSGTSMATPHVAGLAALAAAARGLNTPAELREALRSAASPFEGVPSEQQGAGMADAGRIVAQN